MSGDLYGSNSFVFACVDDSNFAVVFSGVFASVADVYKLRMRFEDDAVRSHVKVDRIEKFERVRSKDPDHSVVPACHKQLVEIWKVQDPLRLLESGDAAHPLACLQIQYL